MSKGIDRFYHFTDIRNLDSIIKYGGLYSWYSVEKHNISTYFSSNNLSKELDVYHNLHDYVRLSFTNYHPMSTKIRYENGKSLIWLEIDIEVACWETTLFSDRNATDNNVVVSESFDFLKQLNYDVFKKEYRQLDFISKKQYQAEILVKNFLPLQYITNINELKERYL